MPIRMGLLMAVRIKELPKNDRPRERLLQEGVDHLSNEELLAILLKTGGKDSSAKELALSLLTKLGPIAKFRNINIEQLLSFRGIGPAKACELMAAIELSKRIHIGKEPLKGKKIVNSDMVFDYYKHTFADEEQECFYVLYLNQQKKVICEKLLFKGTINYSIVHPREVFKEAYLTGATSFICIHNHPSGNVTPSKQDMLLTKQLQEIGKIMGIVLDDHLIIGLKNYYSFFENGHI